MLHGRRSNGSRNLTHERGEVSNGEKGWKEKGRQEAVVAVPPVPGVLRNDTPSFFQLARSRRRRVRQPDRELAPRRAVPLRATADVPGGRCFAVDASNGSRNLTHERGEVSNGEKRRKEKGRQEALVPFQEAVLSGRLLCSQILDLRF